MEHRVLGKTGLSVSVIGFGGAPIGIPKYLGAEDRDDPRFQQQAIEALRAAAVGGINYYDTAPGYGRGRSERLIGQALEGLRGRVLLATKYALDGEPMTYQQRTGSFHASLDRLRTDHVEVLQLHGQWWDQARADAVLKSDVLAWADEMRRRGLARFLGITAEGPSGPLEQLLATGRFDVIEIAYNAIYQSACDYQREPRGIIPLAKSMGMGVTTMRTATSGVLQKLLRSEFEDIDLARVTRMAINFVLSTPEVDCAVVGMRTPQEVRENIALAEENSRRVDLRRLHDRFDGTPVA